jgi:HlyD family secretion protein
MDALVHTDSHQHPFKGKVSFISPQAEFTPKTVETAEIRTDLVYRIRVLVNDPKGELRQGMPVDIYLLLEENHP